MPDIFEAGDTVPASGVYKVFHENMHIPPHHVTAIYGDTFPSCPSRSNFSEKADAGGLCHRLR
jgi:hypothetical protein